MPGPGEGDVVAYFGYGSLVCRATHRTRILAAVPATLKGWRRAWRPRPDMPGLPAALLTVRPDPASTCDGLLVFDRAEHLAAVDAREARYRRVPVRREDLQVPGPLPHECPIWLYVAEEEVPAHRQPPMILRSYLEAVLHGFAEEHGEDGLRRFLSEKDGFDTPIHDDRDRPLYPRAVRLDPERAALIDRALASVLAAAPKAG